MNYSSKTILAGLTALFMGASCSFGQTWLNGGTNSNILFPSSMSTRVGIGVGVPQSKLHVKASGQHAAIFEDGFVGIGTSSPIDDLHVVRNHNERTWLRMENNTSGNKARVGVSIGAYNPNISGWNGFVHCYNSADYVHSGIVGTAWQNKAVTYTGSGAAGYEVHLATPNQTMAFTRANGGLLQTDLAINAAGNVGVGTNNPNARLHVNGDMIMNDGNQAAGYIMMSDATGRASWVDPAGVLGGGGGASCTTPVTVGSSSLSICNTQVLETGANGGDRLYIGSEGATQPLSWGAFPAGGGVYKYRTSNYGAAQINYHPWSNNLLFNFSDGNQGGYNTNANFNAGMRIWGGNAGNGYNVRVIIGEEQNTANLDAKLHVDGRIVSQGVVVTDLSWADYVFEDDYKLRSLEEVSEFIDVNGHLPDMPSAEEVSEKGVSLGEMDVNLLRKVEEITLYLLEMEAENEALKTRLGELEQQVSKK